LLTFLLSYRLTEKISKVKRNSCNTWQNITWITS